MPMDAWDRRNWLNRFERDPSIPTPEQMNQRNVAGRLIAMAAIFGVFKYLANYFKNKK